MKILLTGGGSGGHFYPIISIAEEIQAVSRENRLVPPQLYYMAPEPYNAGLLFDNNIEYRKNYAGKMRRYFSVLNIIDLFKTGIGILKSMWGIYLLYPDVVFGKGGYASFPALCAARILGIPVVVHESDSVPGRVNVWAGKFARRVALSYGEAAQHFKQKNTLVITGNPVRKEIAVPLKEGSYEFFKLERDIPVILIVGGSLGSQIINDAIIDALPRLVEKYQIIHQTGKQNIKDVVGRTSAMLVRSTHKDRYKAFDYLDTLALRMAAGAATLVISRAGSAIFEIASWHTPSIIIPITDSNGDHQRKNAFAYGRTGAATVIEESNLTPNILVAEIERIMSKPELQESMRKAAEMFVKPDAARLIAKELLSIALEHER